MSYETNRAWSDKWLPEIKRIVGPRLLVAASFEMDAKEASDLVILMARDMTIACRIRRRGYASSYPNQFTIRSAISTGAKTELEKITNGFGDWMFYGHESESEGLIYPWMLIDLHHWRAHMIRKPPCIKYGNQSNGDGTFFAWFDASSFPQDPPLLVAKSYS